jgi:hypothetical protein
MTEVKTADALIIEQTKNWLETIVIGLNFCPFARSELEQNSIHYAVVRANDMQSCLESLVLECERLARNQNIATSLIIYPELWSEFDDFLDYLAIAESLLEAQNYQGTYQLASFHPRYCFEGEKTGDPANYTNRSLYPMLHLIREDMLKKVLKQYPHPEQIPLQNIKRARKLGEPKLKTMLEGCRKKAVN